MSGGKYPPDTPIFISYFRKDKRCIIPNYLKYLDKIKSGHKGLNPFLDFMKIELTDSKEGYARFKMPVRPEYLQGAKAVQGGLLVALADECIAHAMMTVMSPEEGLTTVELKSNFLAGVSSGDLIADATVFKKGKSLIIGDCIVKDDQGRNLCRVSATFMILNGKGKKN